MGRDRLNELPAAILFLERRGSTGRRLDDERLNLVGLNRREDFVLFRAGVFSGFLPREEIDISKKTNQYESQNNRRSETPHLPSPPPGVHPGAEDTPGNDEQRQPSDV